MHTGFLLGNLNKREHWEDLGIDWRIILKWTLRKWDERTWTGFNLSQDMAKWRVVLNRAVRCDTLHRDMKLRHGVVRSRRFESTYCLHL
jgi:hypothetical protein